MGLSSDILGAPKEFMDLFKAGKSAARQGNRAQAHEMFRQAIELDPYHEQVWLWLASVVENDEDKRTCFENVLQLNPSSPTARQQLQHLAEKAAVAEARRRRVVERPRPSAWRRWTRRLVLVVALSAISVVAIVAAQVLLL